MKELCIVGKTIKKAISLKEPLAGKSFRRQVKNNEISIIRRKLQDGVTSISLEDQYCCIEIAINNQNLEMLKVLLRMLGPNLNGFQYILKIINKAVMTNNLDIIKTTLDYLAMYLDNKESAQVLLSAVEKDNVEIIKNVLENLGTYISKEHYEELLSINHASKNFNKKEINTILEKFKKETKFYSIKPFNGNSQNKPPKYYSPIISIASKELRKSVFEGNITKVRSIVEDGVTTIDYASLVIGVRIAIHNYNQEMVSILINIPGVQLKTKDVGYLLKETILNNNSEIVQTLLKKLAPQVMDKYAEESLLLAVTKNNVEVVTNISQNLGSKISRDCYKSALHIANIYNNQDIKGLLESRILRDKTTPESLTFTKSNSLIHSNTNLLRSRSIEESNNHNIPSTENNQRNDFKTGNYDTVDESKRSTSKDGNELNKDNGEDLSQEKDMLSTADSSEEHSSLDLETPPADSSEEHSSLDLETPPADFDAQDGNELNKDNGEDLSQEKDMLSTADSSEEHSSLDLETPPADYDAQDGNELNTDNGEDLETPPADFDDGTLVIMILQHLVDLYNKGNLEGNNYSAPQDTPPADYDAQDGNELNTDNGEDLETPPADSNNSYPNHFDKDKEMDKLYKGLKVTQELKNPMQDTMKIGKEIIDLKDKSKNTKQSDRVPTRDNILENIKTEIDILKLDVKKIKEDLKKYIPNVITNHAVRAFSSNNDNQIFPKEIDDIIVNNYNPSNIIEELFFNAQNKIMKGKFRNKVTNKLANELNELPQCEANFLDTFNIIEFKDINGSCLKIEILPPKTLDTQPQINILPTPAGSKAFSGALSIERMDISGNIIKPKVYDCIRIENGNPVEIVYSDPKPNQKNSRVDKIVKDYNLINTRYTDNLYQSSQDYGINAFTQLT